MSTHDDIIRFIQKHTDHKYIYLTDSGNLAIYASIFYLKKAGYQQLIIPDQGGWLTHRQYPKKFKLILVDMKTDYGLIMLDELEKQCATAKKLNIKTAFLMTSFAGYHAEQPLKEISDICKKYNVLLIEDTNAFSDSCLHNNKYGLCNGKLADIIVCSFGEWKVVNNFHGGFISSNVKEVIDSLTEIEEKIKPKDLDEKKLLGNLEKAPARLKFLLDKCSQVKKDLIAKGINVFHKDSRGIGVIAEHKQEVIDYCKNNNLEYTECPRYIRVNEKAISIELKRLEN